MFKKTFLLLNFLLLVTGCASSSIKDDKKGETEETAQVTSKTVNTERLNESLGAVASLPITLPLEQASTNFSVIEADSGTDSTAKTEDQSQPPEFLDPITQALLERGDHALAKLRLLTPEEDNANLYYQAALGRSPGNYRATMGIASIVEQYCNWALEAARAGNQVSVHHYLEQAKLVNPQDPLIGQTQRQILAGDVRPKSTSLAPDLKGDESITSDKETGVAQPLSQVILPESLFSLSEEEILARMQPIIDELNRQQRRIEINWPSDKEARLIYQIINSRTPAYRVRAMIYHRPSYSVEFR
ncbi:hypothetical protein FJM67_04610 [Maribrevibacterium harenarium]|uniref:Lipoprotein n=1 Tax=Maribrevibacterium harenarium TaxID=2589817 RepID=A0A501X257_9GAMM|nr:hypothetical protein [Maribrevibacterium harenarium]TPE54547.1 hypothetical protein FJM67_04610 [Maribrevibacterium harenarium]